MPGKLTEEQNRKVREALSTLVARCDGNVSAVARLIHKDQSWVHRFIKGQQGASLGTAAIIAQNSGQRVSDLLGIANDPIVTWSELPGFDDAYAQARAAAGSRFSDVVWERVGGFSMPPHPAKVEAWMLLQVAGLVESLHANQLTPGPSTLPPADGQNKSERKLRSSKRR